jgi:DNA-binding MarR family transcriptional regulator
MHPELVLDRLDTTMSEPHTGSELSSTLLTWTGLLRAHAAATHLVSGRLQAEHGLSINDYETLSALSHAPRRRLRGVDLARRLLLTPSGVTRLLDRLEGAGLVERKVSDADQRVAYAQLTANGAAKLEAAGGNHIATIRTLLETHLSATEIAQLGNLLGKLSTA